MEKLITCIVFVAAASTPRAASRPREWCMSDHHWPQLVPGKFDFKVVQFGTKCD